MRFDIGQYKFRTPEENEYVPTRGQGQGQEEGTLLGFFGGRPP